MTSRHNLEERLRALHSRGIVDLHFDLPMDLYEKRSQPGALVSHYLPELDAGGVGVIGAAIYIEDRYLAETALRVGLDQVARLYAEVETSERFAICRTYDEIVRARASNRIAVLITMEGVEPLGDDLNLLRVFYELGLRAVGLTHARRNMAADGGGFPPSGPSRHGLSDFGRGVVAERQLVGLLIGLSHPNPAGALEL